MYSFFFISISLWSLSIHLEYAKRERREDRIKIEYKRQLALAKLPLFLTREDERFNASTTNTQYAQKRDTRLTEAGKAKGSTVSKINNWWRHKLTKGGTITLQIEWPTTYTPSFTPGCNNRLENKKRKIRSNLVWTAAGIHQMCVCVHHQWTGNGAHVCCFRGIKHCIVQIFLFMYSWRDDWRQFPVQSYFLLLAAYTNGICNSRMTLHSSLQALSRSNRSHPPLEWTYQGLPFTKVPKQGSFSPFTLGAKEWVACRGESNLQLQLCFHNIQCPIPLKYRQSSCKRGKKKIKAVSW